MQTVLIVGYYGMGNFGDDEFVSVALQEQGSLWPGSRALILAPGSGRDYAVPAFLEAFWRRRDMVGTLTRLLWSLAAVPRCSTISFFGGSVLSRLSLVQQVQIMLARILRRRIELVGVSIGPFADCRNRKRVQQICQRADRIVVRDSSSSELLLQWHIQHTLSMDPVFMRILPDQLGPQGGANASKRTLVAIPCSTARDCGGVNILDALAALERKGVEVTVLVLNNHKEVGDVECGTRWAEAAAEGKTRNLVVYKGSSHEVWSTVHKADVVLSARLHGAIAASRAETPFALMNYHKKCSSFVAGSDDDTGRLLELDDDDDSIVAVVEYLLESRGGAVSSSEIRAEALRNYRVS